MATPPADERDPIARLRDLEAMLDSITDYAIFTLDMDGNVASWRAPAQALLGYEAHEILGRPISTFYTEEDQRTRLVEHELTSARQTGRFEIERMRVRKNGEQFWASVILTPIPDEAGAVTGYAKVVRDITERREFEQRLQRQRDEILELSTPVIQVWDKVLVLPLIGTLDTIRAARLTEALLEKIADSQSEVVIIDISGVPTIDTQVAQHLMKTVQAAALMGSVSIMSGVRPETAQAMVHLGIDLGQLHSRHTLGDALQLALAVLTERSAAAGAAAQTLTGKDPRE